MKQRYMFFFFFLYSVITSLWAVPTSLFWTNCTTGVQPEHTARICALNYFPIKHRHCDPAFPIDVGATYGLFSFNGMSAEAGVDFLAGTSHPFFFNAKVGVHEDWLFSSAPSLSVGIYNVGTRTGGPKRTNQNIIDVVLGKSLPELGTVYLGGFSGSHAMGKNHGGVMVGYSYAFCKRKYVCDGREYNKWAVLADYASGKNTIGGGGIACSYYFTPDAFVTTGPVWFNSAKINGRWKWSLQLYVDV